MNSVEQKCDSLELPVVCSLLYNAGADNNVPWKSRLRACYAIEWLMSKKEKYFKFFTINATYLGNVDIEYMQNENAKAGQEL